LSAQTQDERTAQACQNLFAVATTPEQILALDLEQLKTLIRPAGMYNNKAKNLRLMSQQILDRHDGAVPNDRAALMQLAGVGRKSTDIMMRFVFQEPAIAVDTHVHRISNRLGIARTRAEHKTAEVLERDTPDQYRWGAHEWLIQHGKYVCRARNPGCDQCMLADMCDYRRKEPAL
jgi:endonuclease-3